MLSETEMSMGQGLLFCRAHIPKTSTTSALIRLIGSAVALRGTGAHGMECGRERDNPVHPQPCPEQSLPMAGETVKLVDFLLNSLKKQSSCWSLQYLWSQLRVPAGALHYCFFCVGWRGVEP